MWYHFPHMDTEFDKAGEPARRGSPKAKAMNAAASRHAAPFLIWIGIMLLAQGMHLVPSSASEETEALGVISDAGLYALRTVAVALALLLSAFSVVQATKPMLNTTASIKTNFFISFFTFKNNKTIN